jgi:hypothetical protein
MNLAKKIVSFLLIFVLLSTHSFALFLDEPAHNITLRLGGSIDRNRGIIHHNAQEYSFGHVAGSFGLGVVYDFFAWRMFSLSPEFHYHAARTAEVDLDGNTQTTSWHELSSGLQLKFNLYNLFYMGVGPGISFATTPSNRSLSSQSSLYPYLATEIGGNVPLKELKKDLLLNLHFALRGTSNINSWIDSELTGKWQNDFSISFWLGVSLFFAERYWV